MKKQTTLFSPEDYLQTNLEQMTLANARIGFKKYFDLDAIVYMDRMLSHITGKYELDIIKLDDYFHRIGYNENSHGSLKSYITTKYGIDASRFIEQCLK